MYLDFILCIGDDKSNEDMFEMITRSLGGPMILFSAWEMIGLMKTCLGSFKECAEQ